MDTFVDDDVARLVFGFVALEVVVVAFDTKLVASVDVDVAALVLGSGTGESDEVEGAVVEVVEVVAPGETFCLFFVLRDDS